MRQGWWTPSFKTHPRVHLYKPGDWGPKQADALIAADGRWHNSTVAHDDCS
jgi:glucose-6-phosphate 1-dehydrogenase